MVTRDSPRDGQAEQLVVFTRQGSGSQSQLTDLVGTRRARIAHAGLPAGLSAHLAGAVATQVDQQKASGNQGGKVQDFSALLISVLLLLIFRSA